VWLHINRVRLKAEAKKFKPIINGPFTILGKIGTNSFLLDLSSYMQIYSVVNIKNLKLYEPPKIMNQRESVSVPSVDKFAPEYLDELKADIFPDRRTRTSRKGDVEYI
jgi:hypothetical protein